MINLTVSVPNTYHHSPSGLSEANSLNNLLKSKVQALRSNKQTLMLFGLTLQVDDAYVQSDNIADAFSITARCSIVEGEQIPFVIGTEYLVQFMNTTSKIYSLRITNLIKENDGKIYLEGVCNYPEYSGWYDINSIIQLAVVPEKL